MSASTPHPPASGAHAEGVPPSAARVASDGLFCGVLGGLTVALFFLVVDALEGQPLRTPSLLGSVLFLGQGVSEVQGLRIAMVFAYSGVHMAAFVAAGMAASYMVAQFEKNPPFGLLLLLLFLCFEAGFLAFAFALMPGVVGTLGTGLVVVANLLSAAVMAAYLLWNRPHAVRGLEHIWDR